MIPLETPTLLIVVVAGLACGFLNTVASSGSAVSLPILMWVGLQAIDADATNRIPVLIGAAAASADLAFHKMIPWRMALLASVPVTIGAAVGAQLAETVPSHYLRLFITAAVVAALILILTKLKDVINSAITGAPRFSWAAGGWLFLIGIWLGFIVLDGATYVLLALVLAVRLANRSKVERASRSIRVTVTTSPGARAFRSLSSSRRSARAPVTFSR
jgi:uncharacterized membrane protein YfcA